MLKSFQARSFNARSHKAPFRSASPAFRGPKVVMGDIKETWKVSATTARTWEVRVQTSF